jgi:hypothetical protein
MPPAGFDRAQVDLSRPIVRRDQTERRQGRDRVSVAELAAGARGIGFDGQPLAGDHAFDCSSTTLVLTIPPGGKLGGSWTFARS